MAGIWPQGKFRPQRDLRAFRKHPAPRSHQFCPSLLRLDAQLPTQTFPETTNQSKQLSSTYPSPALCWAPQAGPNVTGETDACTASSDGNCRHWSHGNLGLSPHCASTNWVTLGTLLHLSLSFCVCKVVITVPSPWSCGEKMCFSL